ncbi:hypothetical protein GCM10010448_27830 [Streptomyces glomeratus]|uniref:Uncharacterized protein n=1 Tax=Streptomyces glomeratus TaxID=284452 RepID=A0ABP6LJC3_9ACTN
MDELPARLRAAVRRSQESPLAPGRSRSRPMTFTVDLQAGKAARDGRDVRLTPTEWHLTTPSPSVTSRPGYGTLNLWWPGNEGATMGS